jgi:bifunctional DNase/RNase
MDIAEVVLDDAQAEHQLLLQEIGGDGRLRLACATREATAVLRCLLGLPRPTLLLVEVWAKTVHVLGSDVVDVCLKTMPNQDRCAEVRVRQAERIVGVDMAPADGVLLALTCNLPIRIEQSLLE